MPKRFRIHRACILDHTDFIMGKDTFHNLENFDWGEHAYSILYRYIPQFANHIQTESEYAFSMTRGCFGSEKVDTGPFRFAI